jgi:hypothetical protein
VLVVNSEEYFAGGITYTLIKIMDGDQPQLLETVGALATFTLFTGYV